MLKINRAVQIRRRLLTAMANSVWNGNYPEELDSIPVKLYPRTQESHRCCIYKDRAITRDRMLAVMGYEPSKCDELISLREYGSREPEAPGKDQPDITVIPDACSTCLKSRYIITNGCRGCLARPCQNNCPKNAISFIDGKAVIQEDKCVNCGLCLNNCPFNAIIYMPLPCEEACPVKAVEKDTEGRIRINKERCISCGRCYTACPFGAVMIRSQLISVLRKLKDPDIHVTALPAPSLGGQFPEEWPRVLQALLEAGFSDIKEVAEGALETTKKEAEELLEKRNSDEKIMTTSCCPGYVQWTRKHNSDWEEHLSQTPSPMKLTGRAVKKKNPQTVTVFITPCAAKRVEIRETESIDHILSFEELGTLFIAAGIEIAQCPESEQPEEKELNKGRRFACSGGVSDSVLERIPPEKHPKVKVFNGIDRKTAPQLSLIKKREEDFHFIEVMCCPEGCIGGPETLNTPQKAGKKIRNWIEG